MTLTISAPRLVGTAPYRTTRLVGTAPYRTTRLVGTAPYRTTRLVGRAPYRTTRLVGTAPYRTTLARVLNKTNKHIQSKYSANVLLSQFITNIQGE